MITERHNTGVRGSMAAPAISMAVAEPTPIGEAMLGTPATTLLSYGARQLLSAPSPAVVAPRRTYSAAKGEKSLEEYLQHVQCVEAAERELEDLRQELRNARGPKKRRPIEEAIERLNEALDGHKKEIRQKWPDGPPLL